MNWRAEQFKTLGGKALTPRQREIVQLLCDGLPPKGVAYELKLSPKTVYSHLSVIMHWLGIKRMAHLAHWAIREGVTNL